MCNLALAPHGKLLLGLDEPPPFLPSVYIIFRRSSDSVYYCEHKEKIKTGEASDRV